MNCATHHYVPTARAYFQVLKGASWAIEYCRCGAVQWHFMSPVTGPIAVDQLETK